MSHKLYKLTVTRYWSKNAWHVKRTIKPAFMLYDRFNGKVKISTTQYPGYTDA